MKTIRIMTLCLATILVLAGAARAQTTFYVRGVGGSDANNGQSWATAFATLQKGLDQLASTVSNLLVNVQESTGTQAYYVGNRSSMGTVARLYEINIQGGWTDVDGTPAQTGKSVVTDNIGPIDQPGLTIAGAPTHGTPRTVTVNRMEFTNVTHGIYMTLANSLSKCDQILNVSNCTITAENHGIFMDYQRASRSWEATRGPSTLRLATSTIACGRSGSGDGIRILGTYPLLDVASDVSVTSVGGANVSLSEMALADTFTNAFRGTFSGPPGGYDLTKNGRSSAAYLPEAATFTRNVSCYGGAVRTLAQNVGRALGTGTVELNGPTVLRLDGVAGADALLGPIAVRKGQSSIHVNGASVGNTWTADALTRENRSVLFVGGNGGVNNQFLITTNDRLKLASAPAVTNGMVAPYFLMPSGDFLSYNSTFGFTGATYTATSVNSATATDLVAVTSVQTVTADRSAYALWLRNYNASITNDISGPYTLTLGSGGLSVSYNGYFNDSLIAPHLRFGTAGEKEALICVGVDYYSGQVRLSGSLITTNGLTKSGFGTLRLLGDSSATFQGPVTVNNGTLALDVSNALSAGVAVDLQAAMRRDLLVDASNPAMMGGQLELSGNNLSASSLTLADRTWIGNSSNTPCTLAMNGNITYNGAEYAASIAPLAGKQFTLDLGSARRTFNVADGMDAADLSVAAVVTGTGGLLKTGPGRLDLTASNNTFSGGIILKEGMLTGWLTTNTFLVTPFGDVNNTIDLTNAATLHFYRSVLQHGATTTVGRVTVAGGNVITFTSVNNYYSTNVLAALDRVNGTRGTLLFQGGPNTSARDFPGQLVNLRIAETPSVVNGMLPPWVLGRGTTPGSTASYHLTYDAVLGVKVCTYEVTDSFSVTAGQKVNIRTTPINVTANKSLWALRTGANITQSGGSWTLAIGSGSLLLDATVSVAPIIQFGATGTDEGVVYVNLGMTGTLTNSIVTSGGLTKFGDGILSLPVASPSFSGPVWVQAGTISLGHGDALGTGTAPIYIQTGARLDYYCNATLARPLTGAGSITTGPNLLTVAAAGSLTPGIGDIGTLQVEDLDFRGTYNWEYNETGSDLIKAVNLTFGGSPQLNVTWLGGGSAPMGQYEVFRYLGAAPSLAGWTVATPSGQQGTLTLDADGKRVLLTLNKSTSGTFLLFR